MKRSLYREYRPQTFEQLVGQQHVARTLHNALETGSVAHAYVFAGPRGTGKTSAARILAKSLNCVGTEERPASGPTAVPCGVCRSCQTIASATSLDVIEMDAASNRSIDDIRELRDRVAFAPVEGRFKVYIIDEVHMLTREAFNALLKTLEEPPANVVFVLATTEPHKIPETILSRCQRFDFHRPHPPEIARLLRRIVEDENARPDEERGGPTVEIQDAALLEIARHSQGGFRDAIGTLEKLIAFSDGAIVPGSVLDLLGVTDADLLFELTEIVIERRTAEGLQFVQRLADAGTDYTQFIRDLLRHLRQLFLLQHLDEAADDVHTLRALAQTVELDEQALDRLLPQAHQLHPREIVHAIETLGQAQREIREGLDARLQFELALVKMTRPQVDHSPAGLEERLRRLEAAVAGGKAPAPAASGGKTPAPAASGDKAAPSGHAASGAKDTRAAGGPEASKATPEASAQADAVSAAGPAGRPRAAAQPGEDAEADAEDGADAAPQANAEAEVEPAAGKAAPGTPGADDTAEAAPHDTAEAAAHDSAEPAADDAAEATAVDPASVPTLDRIRRAWELVLQRVQAASVPLYALLRDARPAALEGDVLVVGMPSPFALKRAGEAGNADRLAAAVEEVLGWRLSPRFTLATAPPDEAQADAGKQKTSAPQEVDFTTMIRMAEETFDAEQLPDDQ
jgi:DNA polymerase-3 subunit gamma/tau